MRLPPGTRIGAYELVASLGAGGMGEVYRARDTRLERTVALKVLPPEFADPDARARFEREARAIAAFNHPNICTLHDFGCANGLDFLVMELLEGETLAARLARGPLSLEHAIAVAQQIAGALDRAHQRGHRASRSQAGQRRRAARQRTTDSEAARFRIGESVSQAGRGSAPIR